jgi:hypothetical protein
MTNNSYVIEESDKGRTLVVTGPWNPEADRILRLGEVDGLNLNYVKGFCESSLAFFEDWPLRRLAILDRSITNLEPIRRFASSLEELSVEAAPEARLDLSRMANLHSVAGAWHLLRSALGQLDSLQSIMTSKYDEANMLPLIDHPNLERLTIKDAPRIESLQGITALRSLSNLGIHLARKLTDITDLADATPSLAELRFEYCSGIASLGAIANQIDLCHLGVNDCRSIGSLSPIRHMSKLSVFHAWGSTRIVDNDLTILLQLPLLRELRLKSRKEYRPSVEDVKAALNAT